MNDRREYATQCRYRTVSLLLILLSLSGCDNTPSGPKPSSEKLAGGYDADVMTRRISESMSKLSPEDRKLAEAQKFCPVGVEFDDDGKPVAGHGLLGSMDKPVKMTVKDQSMKMIEMSCLDFMRRTCARRSSSFRLGESSI